MHPNLIPVLIQTPSDLEPLIQQMKEAGRRDPDLQEGEWSPDSATAFERAERVEEDILESGHLRVIVIPGTPPPNAVHVECPIPLIPVAVVLTLDLWRGYAKWDLSLAVPMQPTPRGEPADPCRLEDEHAFALAKAFLGDFEETTIKGPFTGTRQFVSREKEPMP